MNTSLKKCEMPHQLPEVRNKNFDEVALGYTEEMAIEEAGRCLNCKNKPCVSACPVHVHIPAFIEKVASGDFEAAYKIIELEKIKDADGLTCNCGTISGGTVPNTVPGECHFCVNIRFANSEQREWIEKKVRELAETVFVKGCTTTLEPLGDRVAMEYTERNVEFLEKMNDIFEENGLSRLKAGKATGGSDAAYVTEAGIPCVDSMSATGGEIHSPDEFAEIESLREQTKRIASVAYCIE